jgi:AcrR family transcriptional regulator
MPRVVDHDERRAQLTEATAREIARVGLENVRLREIARDAGWTTGVVSHYFPDKRGLLLATFRSRSELARQRVAEAMAAGATALDATIETVLPLNDEQRLTWQVWLAFWGAAVGDDVLTSEQQLRYESFRASLADAVRAEQRAGRMDAVVDPEHEARHLLTLLDGIAVQALFAPAVWPPEAQRALVEEHLAPLRPGKAAAR